MSVVDNIKDVAENAATAVGLEPVAKLLEQIPAEALEHVVRILEGALAAHDPVRYLKRIAIAQAAHEATKATLGG